MHDPQANELKPTWTRPRLRYFLSVLSELPTPLVERQLYMIAVRLPGGSTTKNMKEEYKLTQAGKGWLQMYRQGDCEQLMLPTPLFLLQEGVGEDEDEYHSSDDDSEDVLGLGETYIVKGGEKMYVPDCIVKERTRKGKLEYLVCTARTALSAALLCENASVPQT